METLISFETAKLAKEKGFWLESGVSNFYTKPNSKIFGVDEHGRTYPIKNKARKLFNSYQYRVLNIENVILAPTQSLLQKWLREKYKIDVWAQPFMATTNDGKFELYLPEESYSFYVFKDGLFVTDGSDRLDFEQALEEGLQEALKLI